MLQELFSKYDGSRKYDDIADIHILLRQFDKAEKLCSAHTPRKLNFTLLKQELLRAYGYPTFRTITIPSSCNLSELRKVLKERKRIATSNWNTTLLEDLDPLSDKFTEQPDRRAIHLIVDGTNAVVSATEPRWSIDEVPRDTVIQEVIHSSSAKFKEFQRFDSRKFSLTKYQPASSHTHFRAISKLSIPKVMERPLLLLYNLPRNGSGGFVDTEHLESSLQFDSVRRLAVIVGASGSGKSRMAIELLCRKFGFYFTCATGGTEHAIGSRDIQSMVSTVTKKCNDSDMDFSRALSPVHPEIPAVKERNVDNAIRVGDFATIPAVCR
ncbi:hypothetical protein BZG36_04913 [Bifiguratus adelaidae]|uniref:Uncharacterized protein n=1 Tax=Bifiguratus adelaidae TaxID=1938954 RepID=A0A261XVI2_9FUNG|nr:hypothetical protein BZG36_04913 [Bifiguratus adelaidae]